VKAFEYLSTDGYTFKSDERGMVEVAYRSWNRTPVKSVFVSGRALIEFAGECVRHERIQELETMSTDDILMRRGR
jgi:hypothetical protein